MEKTAQKRSLLNRLHEMANVPARSAEEFFKPELKRVMKTLSDADDMVRSILAGDKVGNALPEDKVSAKSLLKEAKSFVNRREYMSAIANLGRFHKKMSDAADVLKNLNLNVDALHHKFLFEKLPSDQRRHLQGLRERLGQQQNNLAKEAGIMDFFYNIGTQRGRALAAWEKRYPKEVGPIRDGALSQLDNANSVLDQVLALLKQMAGYRAARRIDNYLDTAKEVVSIVNRYDNGKNGFRSFYTDVVKPRLERLEAEEKQSNPNIPVPSGDAPVGSPAGSTVNTPPSSRVFVPGDEDVTLLPPPPKVPTNLGVPPAEPTTDPAPPPVHVSSAPPDEEIGAKSEQVLKELQQPVQASFAQFTKTLQTLSQGDPRVVAAFIRKYATSIQAQDPTTAIKLFNIAKSLRG